MHINLQLLFWGVYVNDSLVYGKNGLAIAIGSDLIVKAEKPWRQVLFRFLNNKSFILESCSMLKGIIIIIKKYPFFVAIYIFKPNFYL